MSFRKEKTNGDMVLAPQIWLIVYSVNGHTWIFKQVSNVKYHSKNLTFSYHGRFGFVDAEFNDIAGIVKIKKEGK